MKPAEQPHAQIPRVSIEKREAALLAPYAFHSADSRGRKHPEPPHPYRGPFQRDRDRIVHSAAYRRLSSKTQVFTGELGDYHRTRLTHTHEVASISRTLARALALNEDLVEALALVHDLGHPPFGHAGEDTLDECLRDEGGFSHNLHALRIVELLEKRYPNFPGLNLSLEVLEGQQTRTAKGTLPSPLLEVQVVEAADSVAYNTHDADDALELGLVTLDEMLSTALWAGAGRRVKSRYRALEPDELRRAVLHELIDWQVGDLLEQTSQRIEKRGIDSTAAVRDAGMVVAPSQDIGQQKKELERFLHQHVYRHPNVLAHRERAQQFLRQMFDYFVGNPGKLPKSFVARAEQMGVRRSVGDYVAGMTDRYLEREYARLVPPQTAVG